MHRHCLEDLPKSCAQLIWVKERDNEIAKNKVEMVLSFPDLGGALDRSCFEDVDRASWETIISLLSIANHYRKALLSLSAVIALDLIVGYIHRA